MARSSHANGALVTADEARNCQLKLLNGEAQVGRGDRSKGIGYLGIRPRLSLHGTEEGLRCEHTKGRRNGRQKRAASTLGAQQVGYHTGASVASAARPPDCKRFRVDVQHALLAVALDVDQRMAKNEAEQRQWIGRRG
eukprot:scaffold12461_cov67-Phaeocystis_antarctica.AAC.5